MNEYNPWEFRNFGKGEGDEYVAINSKGKGKSGGARVITNVVVIKTTVYLLDIYENQTRNPFLIKI